MVRSNHSITMLSAKITFLREVPVEVHLEGFIVVDVTFGDLHIVRLVADYAIVSRVTLNGKST